MSNTRDYRVTLTQAQYDWAWKLTQDWTTANLIQLGTILGHAMSATPVVSTDYEPYKAALESCMQRRQVLEHRLKEATKKIMQYQRWADTKEAQLNQAQKDYTAAINQLQLVEAHNQTLVERANAFDDEQYAKEVAAHEAHLHQGAASDLWSALYALYQYVDAEVANLVMDGKSAGDPPEMERAWAAIKENDGYNPASTDRPSNQPPSPAAEQAAQALWKALKDMKEAADDYANCASSGTDLLEQIKAAEVVLLSYPYHGRMEPEDFF